MTNKATETIDWGRYEAKAKTMTGGQLWGALIDIRKTLPSADRLDREHGGNRGGYYRDEASIYHTEMRRRRSA